MTNLLWGIDLGGTKTEGIVLDASDLHNPLCRIRVDTEASGGYDHIIEQLGSLVAKMKEAVGKSPERIGFGTPGVLDPQLNGMKNCNTTCLNGRPLRDDLVARLGIPCVLANDANCFALSEARMGAGKGAKNVFGVILGTGVGGGVVINGEVLSGYQGIAGEWGHNILLDDGPPCYCGKKGCVEQCISGTALERFYKERTGTFLKLKKIEEASTRGDDDAARATIDRLVSLFGRAISVVINILDPDVVVLGGGVSNIARLYTDGIEETKRFVFNNRLETKIVRNQLGDSAGVFGAALLAPLP